MEEIRPKEELVPKIPHISPEANIGEDKTKELQPDLRDFSFPQTNYVQPVDTVYSDAPQKAAKASIASVDQEIKPASSNTIVHSAATHTETIANGEFRLNPNSPGMSPAKYLESMINGSDKKE